MQVEESRDYIDSIQAANGYDTRIDPVPACSANDGSDEQTCHAVAGCAWGTPCAVSGEANPAVAAAALSRVLAAPLLFKPSAAVWVS